MSSTADRRAAGLYIRLVLLSLCLLIFISAAALGRNAAGDTADMREEALDVFLDGMSSRERYIKEKIPYVNYVRDAHRADLYILYTSRSGGSGDTEYTLTFLGRKAFTGVNDTLTCFCRNLDTEERCRSELVRIMKLGLVRYVSRTPQADVLHITHEGAATRAEPRDGWDYWVFNVGASGYVSGEESYKSLSYYTSVSADRVTEDLKLNFGFSYTYTETRYEYLDPVYINETEHGRFSGLIAKSMSDHWTCGIFLSSAQSVYGNIDRSWEAAPAVEYCIFPYEETSRRDLRFVYRAGYRYNDYEEETIYYEIEEGLYYSQLSMEFDMKAIWGTFSSNATASHYFHDFELNRFIFDNTLSFRVLEGLSLSVSGSYAAIHDQIALARRGATEEEVLLRRRELATQYDYFFRLGLIYRFGSRYSNVINPRF